MFIQPGNKKKYSASPCSVGANERMIWLSPKSVLLGLPMLCFLLAVGQLPAQSEGPVEWWRQIEVKPTATLQIWSSYTMGQAVFDETGGTYEAVDNRLNFQLRRGRLSLKGKAGDQVKFNLTIAGDLVGRDVLAGTEGGANNGGSPIIRLWNAYVLWRLVPDKEYLHLATGYMVPQIGRESTTSAFKTPSMEKSWTQNYLRRHLVGTGPGRSVGVNLGGLLFPHEGSQWSSRYDLGVFNPAQNTFGGNSTGRRTAPLVSARYMLTYGEPEARNYRLSNPVLFFKERWGVSMAVAGAWQSRSDFFEDNYAAGVDMILSIGWWTLDGELFQLGRKHLPDSDDLREDWSLAETGHLRLSRLFDFGQDRYLQPAVSYHFLHGGMSEQEQLVAQDTRSFAGEEWYSEVALNWYFSQRFKISGSYTHRGGETGDFGPGAGFNNYLFQSGVGPIERGDWLGLGLTATF